MSTEGLVREMLDRFRDDDVWGQPIASVICVQHIMSRRPDLIVLTGDFVCRFSRGIPGGLLSDLRAPHGVFAVLRPRLLARGRPGGVGPRGRRSQGSG